MSASSSPTRAPAAAADRDHLRHAGQRLLVRRRIAGLPHPRGGRDRDLARVRNRGDRGAAVALDLLLERTRRGGEHERERHLAIRGHEILDHAERHEIAVQIRILDFAEGGENLGFECFRQRTS
jgi:hypothetical protein